MLEHLLVEIVDGPLKGQIFTIPANGTLLVGRLPECGLSIPQDLTVSRQHCRIEFTPPDCRLVHLSHTGQTNLNGVSVSTAELRSGDCISFGTDNVLRIRIEKKASAGIATVSMAPVEQASSGASKRFVMSPVSCGWTVYRSADSELGFEQLLEILGRSQALYALIDFRRLGQPVPPELADSQYLFTWLPAAMQSQFSPMLVVPSGNPMALKSVVAGWGRDGIVCFGSKLKDEELLAHWKTAIGAKGDQPGPSMTVYYWPSLLNTMLTCQSGKQLSPLLSGLDWIFVESADSPGNWNLYADDRFASVLKSGGLVPVEQ